MSQGKTNCREAHKETLRDKMMQAFNYTLKKKVLQSTFLVLQIVPKRTPFSTREDQMVLGRTVIGMGFRWTRDLPILPDFIWFFQVLNRVLFL